MTNGEKYKTAKARTNAFNDYCERKDPDCNGCPLSGNKEVICRYAWLDLEAEEEKPMNCPFCGRNTIAVVNGSKAHKGQFAVQCYNREDECCYTGPFKSVRDEAIAAHNRVCKAVLAYKENN